MKSSGIGGQAVLEGVMMKNQDKYAVAVRKPDQEIAVNITEYHSISERILLFRLPIIRGIVTFAESLGIGMKTLTYSASFFEEEDTKEEKTGKNKDKIEKQDGKKETIGSIITVTISILLAVAIFMILPYFISQLLNKSITSQKTLTLVEGLIRILLFIGYVAVISRMQEIKRVFMYHGAEHKTINCIENGYELTIKNVKRQSRHHKRCGTSFMLIVMLISIIFFMFIQVSSPILRLILRLLLIPAIAGVSYEVIRFAGNSEDSLKEIFETPGIQLVKIIKAVRYLIVTVFSIPGAWLQRLTTKEPDDSMIEVAIASVEAVFDWQTFLEENKNLKKSTKIKTAKKVKKQTEDSTTTKNHDELEDELAYLDKILESSVKEDNSKEILNTAEKESANELGAVQNKEIELEEEKAKYKELKQEKQQEEFEGKREQQTNDKKGTQEQPENKLKETKYRESNIEDKKKEANKEKETNQIEEIEQVNKIEKIQKTEQIKAEYKEQFEGQKKQSKTEQNQTQKENKKIVELPKKEFTKKELKRKLTEEEEDDEVLRALDNYFIREKKEN